MNNIDVSVIIVSYNTSKLLDNCIGSVIKNTKDVNYEIIVSDNCSSDDSVQVVKNKYPNVRIIENSFNYGFGKANNIAKSEAKGKYVFYLNSDTVLLNNAIKIFFDYFEAHSNDKISAIGTILLNKDFQPIHSGDKFPTYRYMLKKQMKRDIINIIKFGIKIFKLENSYMRRKKAIEPLEINLDKSKIQYITGADLFMINNEYAIFDENYFMYFEESDMQYQLYKLGYTPRIVEEAKIQHLSFKTSSKLILARPTDIFTEFSMIYYAKKNFNRNPIMLKLLIHLDNINPFVRKIYKNSRDNLNEYYKLLKQKNFID